MIGKIKMMSIITFYVAVLLVIAVYMAAPHRLHVGHAAILFV